MIPNNIHFIFGLKKQTSELMFIHYLAVLSAKIINKPDNIFFYYHYEPYGKWWDKLKTFVELIKVKIPTKWGNEPIKHYAHAADFIRMNILFNRGGIYMDIDTITVNSYSKYLNNKFVMGRQTRPDGLCNAIMMSEPKSQFLKIWLCNYEQNFKSTPPGTKHWDLASIKLPYILSKKFKNLITVLDPETFFIPNWDKCDMIFEKKNDINPKLLTLHLWESQSMKYLQNIKNYSWFKENKNSKTLYGKIGLKLINTYNIDKFNPKKSFNTINIIKKLSKISMRHLNEHNYYLNILNLIGIPEADKQMLKQNKYSFFKIYDVLKQNNKLLFIYPFLLYQFPIYNNLSHEQVSRNVFESYLDFCIDNIPLEISSKMNHIYFNYLFKKNFYLSYTNLNNKKIMEKLNKLYKTFTSIFTDSSKFVKPFYKKKKIKLGIVCNQIFNQCKPVSRDRKNIILNLDKTVYDIYIITSIPKKDILENSFKEFPKILCNFKNFKKYILNNHFDILFYPEIGMDLFTFICGSHRLAPIQIATWGHSETTGMDSMDYYISSKYFNTKDDQKYFSEKLILLDSLGTYYSPLELLVKNEKKERIYKKFKLKPTQNIYNSLQTPGKTCRYEFLKIVKNILSKDPKGIFIALYYSNVEKDLMLKYFENYKNQIKLFKFQPKKNYQELMKITTLLLDPFPFGSLNTSLDSFVFGKIIVAMPSNKINGNFCSGFYKKMDILEPVAYSEEEYVSKVLKFVNDYEYRKKIENKIIERKDALFHEKKSSDEYDNLFKNIYEKHSGFKIKKQNTINKNYNNMLKITENKTKMYKTFIANNNKKVYVDKYSLVWTLDNYNHLISEGMLFRNIVYNDKTSYNIKVYIYDIILPYPRVIPIVENNYEKIQIDTKPKGNEIITWMIAVYNRKDLVKETIDSLLNQTDPNWKCIICDDGSSDGSYEYIKSYVENDDRFDIYTKKNSGYVQTCRFMYEKVNTDVVAIIDSDDVLEPKANEILVNRYRKEKCNAIYTGYMICDHNLKIIKTVIPEIKNNDLLIKNPFEHIRSWRKNCLSPGAYPLYLKGAEDQDLAYRFEEQGIKNILIEKSALVKLRQSKNSLMRTEKTRIKSRMFHYLAKIAALNRRNK